MSNTKIIFITLCMTFVFSACSKTEHHYDGDALLESKCSSCHNLDMPPKTYDDEKAPPMMAVAFHIKDFMKVSSQSDKKPKFIEFFQDFVLHPSVEKSFCDKESLKSYGLMPSQEGKVNKEEIKAIAEFVYEYYNQDKFLAKMQKEAAFKTLPKGKQIAINKGCMNCHKKDKAKVAPSFKDIAKRDDNEIVDTIKHGSKGKWKGFERMIMPSFEKHLTKEEIDTLLKWIKSL